MSIDFKDYYKILGVSKTASDDEVRKAFRKLARLYHPDVAKNNPGAEDKFKEVNEAYEVLSDPEKRRKYDEFGQYYQAGASGGKTPSGWQNFPGFNPGSRPGEFKFNGTGFSDFFEQLFGAMGGPGGSAFRNGRVPQDASPAHEPSQKGDDLEADLLVSLEEVMQGAIRPINVRRLVRCAKCYGVGQVNARRCEVCNGSGSNERTDTYKVKIPVGVQEGSILRVAGQGEAGSAGGPPGDLFLKVHFAKHHNFYVRQGVLHHDLELAPWEAVLGTSASIQTINGSVTIKIPPGTQNGTKLRIKGHGIPPSVAASPGDLVILTKIQIPKTITDQQRHLWEQLARESGFNPREL
ncbi:MAG: DnaJ C-terminal domain-containing protein [Verrucomicrobiales bacterium]